MIKLMYKVSYCKDGNFKTIMCEEKEEAETIKTMLEEKYQFASLNKWTWITTVKINTFPPPPDA